MDTIARRNTDSFEQQIKEVTAKMYAQQIQIDGLQNTISTLYARMNQLEQNLVLQKMQSMGTGPSVRED
jgi:uncharacterized coiled-coil protein SlyX